MGNEIGGGTYKVRRQTRWLRLESIEEVARDLYLKSGRLNGHDLDNWLDAEKIVWNNIEEEVECILELRT